LVLFSLSHSENSPHEWGVKRSNLPDLPAN
jgi:hypothetical protein